MQLERLKDPFPPDSIEWRVQRSGVKNGKPWAIVLAYVQNRAIMDRLDEVCGPGNWKNEFSPAPNGGVMCGISVRVGDEWVTKYDGAENTEFEPVKGGISGAMKRSAVHWGIGRYLYNLSATFANIDSNGKYSDKAKGEDGKHVFFKWNPPALPEWALPKGERHKDPIQEAKEVFDGTEVFPGLSDQNIAEIETSFRDAGGTKDDAYEFMRVFPKVARWKGWTEDNFKKVCDLIKWASGDWFKQYEERGISFSEMMSGTELAETMRAYKESQK